MQTGFPSPLLEDLRVMASKRTRVPRRWRAWRRRLRDQMIYHGIAPAIASEFSAREAQARDRLTALVGMVGAKDATLICATDAKGNERFFLVGDYADVPAHNRDKVRELSLDAITL